MKVLFILFFGLSLYSQDTLATFKSFDTSLSFSSTFDVAQFFYNNVFDYINNNQAPLAKQIFELPAQLVSYDDVQFFINLPAELSVPVVELYDFNSWYLNEQKGRIDALRHVPHSQIDYSKISVEESAVARIPDMALYFPTSFLKFFAGYKTLSQISVGVENEGFQVDVKHLDADTLRRIDLSLSIGGDIKLSTKLQQLTTGFIIPFNEENSFALSLSFLSQSINITSNTFVNGRAVVPNAINPDTFEPEPIIIEYNSTTDNKLGLDISYKMEHVKPQFSLQYTYQPNVKKDEFYKSNVSMNLLIRTPVEIESKDLQIAEMIFPNYLLNGFNINPALLLDTDRDETRSIVYKFDRFKMYLPGVVSASFTYPFKSAFWGAHIAVPLGRFGFEYELTKTENWNTEDTGGNKIPQELIETSSLYKIARSKMILGLSYGNHAASWSDLNWNVAASVLVMDVLDEIDKEEENVSDIILLPFLSVNSSFRIYDKLRFYVKLKAPEVTILKSGLNYSF